MITIIWLKQGRAAHEYFEIRDQQFSYFGRIPQKVSKRVEGRILCGFCVYKHMCRWECWFTISKNKLYFEHSRLEYLYILYNIIHILVQKSFKVEWKITISIHLKCLRYLVIIMMDFWYNEWRQERPLQRISSVVVKYFWCEYNTNIIFEYTRY